MKFDNDFSRRGFLKTASLAAAGTVFVAEQACADTPSPRIKIGQIGTGHMHAYKMGTLRKLTDLFEVVAVADDDPKERKKHENKGPYKDLPWLSSEELLAIPGLQAVAVEVEEHLPLPVALRSVEAGKHVHIDKPAGESLPEFKRILDVAKSKNLAVQMGYMYRNNPAIQFCLNAVRTGLIGDVYDIDAAMCRFDDTAGRNVFKPFRGGAPFIFTCHLIDLVVAMLGKPEKIHPFNRRTRNDGVIDNALTVFEYPHGVLATMRTGINEIEGFRHRHLTVRGSKGVITIRPLETGGNQSGGTAYLALREASGEFKKGEHSIPMPPNKDRYEDQWIEFARIINGTMDNPYPYEHEWIVQECLLEACEMI